jgi:hypothetical protein
MISDFWIIVKVKPSEDAPIEYRVFSSFLGGYLYGDSWRFSTSIKSGTNKADEKRTAYLIETRSGSQYTLYDNRYGSTGYAGSILADYVKAAKESDGKYSVEPLSEEDSIAYLKSLTN